MSLNVFKKKSYVGIDIGHKTIQLVQIDRSGGGWRVGRAFTVATPTDSVSDSVVVDVDAVAMAIKGGLREGRFHASSAVTSVSGGSVIVRLIRDIPKMTEDMLRKSIKYEAGRYVPSSVEDSYIEFEILGDSPEGTMDVLIVAAPREVVESRIKAIEKAGLDVDVVDVESFAAYRSLVESNTGSVMAQMTLALVDIGAAMSTVSVVSQGKFVMTRTIQQGSHSWTEALQTYFKLEEADAESGKAQLDLTPLIGDTVLDNQPLRVLQPHVDDLIREIRRSLNYYQGQQTESGSTNPVTHLLLCGGGAKLKGLAQYVGHKLGIEVVAMSIFDNAAVLPSGDMNPEDGIELSVAAGLAMRSFAKSA